MSNYSYRLLQNIHFSEKRITNVLPKLTIRSFDAGHVIWPKGGRVESWFRIMSGFVAATVPLDTGGQMPVHIYGFHAWFGEQPILTRAPTYLEYTCLTPVEVIGFPDTTFREACRDEVNFSAHLAHMVAWRIQQNSEMLMLMRLGSPCLRVVMGLAQFAEALSYSSDRPPTDALDRAVEIPIKQELIASLCGVSRTLFSSYLQELNSAGWVTISYGCIELLSVETWRRFARQQREKRCTVFRPTIEELITELNASSYLSHLTDHAAPQSNNSLQPRLAA